MIFTEETAKSYEDWLHTPVGRYIDGREKELILALAMPRDGERLLDVGCGTGEHLFLFREKGCDVTGLEPSPFMLEIARQKLGNRAAFHVGKAEDLPFSDNEFDIVTLITSLEFIDDPEKAISEAIRVSRNRVLIGVLNKYSLIGVQRRLKLFRPSVYHSARFFHIAELITMVRNQLHDVHIKWGSVVFLPYGCHKFAGAMEESIPVMKNPFGAFIGLSFPVTFMYRTVQDIIGEPFKIKTESRYSMREVVKGMKE
ncbi:MAG: class I SAM-dependent methyltransferase [Syntrophales bacterium]